MSSSAAWPSTTHDWAMSVDVTHLDSVRNAPEVYAPGGTAHLVLEVIAYAADEAEATDAGAARCRVTLHADGSVSVDDNGRGTDTRTDPSGRPVRKPVMSTKDIRFFDSPEPSRLPDGHPRRGISTVAALSEWLVHTSRRSDGAWSRRYALGIPVSDLLPVSEANGVGTTVHFLPVEGLRSEPQVGAPELRQLSGAWARLKLEVIDERSG